MMNVIVQTVNLTKRYKKQNAIENVNLAIEDGAIYGLLGPNGAGKSTLLKHLAGLLRPTQGQVFLFGEPWQRKHLWQLGTLIEMPSLYGHLTAYENLAVHAHLLGLKKSRISEVLEQVELRDVEKKRVSAFSLGMKQRLGIASALLSHPRLLILDEPTNGLDPAGIREMREMIQQFSRQGITVVVSSHILAEVAQIVTHLGIISKGHLRYQGTLKEFIAHGRQRIELETPQMRQAELLLRPHFPQLVVQDNKLLIPAPSEAAASIVTALTQHNITLTHIDSVQDDLETLFLRLVESDKERVVA
ncbi:ATP-binding cassette domain-containing protein [Ktedonosporobacter rubrisoli]|uniref:ATP-binding cassette domain-containing protein n=1 Tax=Ktedonosporobacter rubrisoli TaxID=2509675 RepID=A0A4P6JLM0_KTERU|nr:ATP-binding cassette domain-containing protein [Ktedonosporobacter rubrisoli]QBD75892.1 ATP-binding cassette domain-containing protein [Ktedonosporobacter rubrisoli]